MIQIWCCRSLLGLKAGPSSGGWRPGLGDGGQVFECFLEASATDKVSDYQVVPGPHNRP